jgi:hypothetical protein
LKVSKVHELKHAENNDDVDDDKQLLNFGAWLNIAQILGLKNT